MIARAKNLSRLNRPEGRKPNLFIVGASRSGTTSLANYLGQHPEIYLSPVKEPCYFISDYGLKNHDEYMSLFRKAGNARAVGEASTAYLFDPEAADSIHKEFPESKIIIILRNPVVMAFSLWRYMTVNGSESKSFKEAVTDEERDYRKTEPFKKSCAGWSWWGNYRYIERALYFNQVKRYIDIFGREQVRVYIFENHMRAPVVLCQDIFNFLGVDSAFVPEIEVLNESGELRFPMIKKIIGLIYPIVNPLISLRLRVRLNKIFIQPIMTKTEVKALIDPTMRKALDTIFRDDIAKLQSLLGHEIREWRSD